MNIRVMIADDHLMLREALEKSLAKEPDIESIAGASTGAETLARLGRELPDVLVLDIALPDMSGIEVARQVSERYPSVNIMALTGYADKVFVEEMLKAGALGYVVKSSGLAGLVNGIRAVAAGHGFQSSEVTAALMRRPQPGVAASAPPVSILSPREQEVLGLIAAGKRSAEIAAELQISVGTVKVHRRNLIRKLKLNSTAELTRYALREGLTRPLSA